MRSTWPRSSSIPPTCLQRARGERLRELQLDRARAAHLRAVAGDVEELPRRLLHARLELAVGTRRDRAELLRLRAARPGSARTARTFCPATLAATMPLSTTRAAAHVRAHEADRALAAEDEVAARFSSPSLLSVGPGGSRGRRGRSRRRRRCRPGRSTAAAGEAAGAGEAACAVKPAGVSSAPMSIVCPSPSPSVGRRSPS